MVFQDASAQLTSAKIMQKANVVIVLMTFVTFFIGTWGEYEKNPLLIGLFTTLSSILGALIMVLHTVSNVKVTTYVKKALGKR